MGVGVRACARVCVCGGGLPVRQHSKILVRALRTCVSTYGKVTLQWPCLGTTRDQNLCFPNSGAKRVSLRKGHVRD